MLLQRFFRKILQGMQIPISSSFHVFPPIVDKKTPPGIQIVTPDKSIVYLRFRFERPDFPGNDSAFEKGEKIVFLPDMIIGLFDEVRKDQKAIAPAMQFLQNLRIFLQGKKYFKKPRPDLIEKGTVRSYPLSEKTGPRLERERSPVQIVPIGGSENLVYKEIQHLGIFGMFQEILPGVPIQEHSSEVEDDRVDRLGFFFQFFVHTQLLFS